MPIQLQENLAPQILSLGESIAKLQSSIDSKSSNPTVPHKDQVIQLSQNESNYIALRLKSAAETVHSSASVVSAARSNVWSGSMRDRPMTSEWGKSQSHIAEQENIDSDAEGELEYELIQELIAKANKALDESPFPEAQSLYLRALDKSKGIGLVKRQKLNLDLASLHIARAYYFQAEYGLSIAILLNLVQECSLDKEHATIILDASYTLGEIYLREKEYGKAETHCKWTIVGRRRLLGKESPAKYEATALLVAIYKAEGDSNEASLRSEMLPQRVSQEAVALSGSLPYDGPHSIRRLYKTHFLIWIP